ncbi:hypothetical protein HAX54_037122, partial [Datura stramonium]|nr:hypothetical protein [Datura stramonium]
ADHAFRDCTFALVPVSSCVLIGIFQLHPVGAPVASVKLRASSLIPCFWQSSCRRRVVGTPHSKDLLILILNPPPYHQSRPHVAPTPQPKPSNRSLMGPGAMDGSDHSLHQDHSNPGLLVSIPPFSHFKPKRYYGTVHNIHSESEFG